MFTLNESMKTEGRKQQRKFVSEMFMWRHSRSQFEMPLAKWRTSWILSLNRWLLCRHQELVIEMSLTCRMVFVLYHLRNVFKSDSRESKETTWSHVVKWRRCIQVKEQNCTRNSDLSTLKTVFSCYFKHTYVTLQVMGTFNQKESNNNCFIHRMDTG